MSSHKEYINEYIASSDPTVRQNVVDELVKLMQNNKLTLLNFIHALQIYITSTNDTTRVSTFSLLSQLLGKLPSTKLFPKDIEVLMAFLYSKLLDRPVVKYVLSSMYSLLTMKYFNYENTEELMQKLIENYNPKEHPQSIRLLALKIVNYQIASIPAQVYPNDLAIDCFLHVSQNEKDPNNLFLIFQVLQKISKTLDITNHIQPLFDTMFRYYPISFKSSTEAQESQVNSLKDSLNSSLASSDLYAVELFPNLISKYNSATSSQVKLDILTTIGVISSLYSSRVIQENFLTLWNTLKYTIINQELAQLISIPAVMSYYEESSNESDQIFHSSLIAIRSLSTNVSNDQKLLVYDDLSKNLILSERNRRFLQSYLTLAIISLPSDKKKSDDDDDDDDDVLRKTLSALFSSDQPLDQVRNKRMILVALSYFSSDPTFISQLVPFRDEILNILQSSLSTSALETTLRTLAVQLTAHLILSPSIISPSTGIEFGLLDEERSVLIGKLGELLIENGLLPSRDFNVVIEKALLIALSKLAKSSRCENDILNEVANIILLQFNNSESSLHEKCVLLNYLIKLAQTPSLVQIISIRLVNLLPHDGHDLNEFDIPVELILQALLSLFTSLPLTHDMNTITKKFLPLLSAYIFKPDSNVNEVQLTYVCELVRRMVAGLSGEIALATILVLFRAFKTLLNMENLELPAALTSLGDLATMESYAKYIGYHHLPILLSAIQGLNVDTNISSKVNFGSLVELLISILDNQKEMTDMTRLQILVGLGVIFNKYLTWNDFTNTFGEPRQSSSLSSDKLEIIIWCLYGLVLKCNSDATEYFVELLGTLSFVQASKAIKIIFTTVTDVAENSGEGDEIDISNGLDIEAELICVYKKEKTGLMMVRNKNKYAVSNLILRNMWKQRILEVMLVRRTEDDSKMNVILPLVLTYLPEDLYSSHLGTLLPNLIGTVESSDDQKVVIAVLKIVSNVVLEQSGRELLKPYLNSIMEIILKNVEDLNKQCSKGLKKQSLRCLLGMCLFDLPAVVPYKKRAIKAAHLTLSDKSRSVRLLGVSVRQAWEDLGVDLSL
ncbi:hypothetical protein PICMEDRAFT_70154 [Pichia membranifaciens NRRL Y-2026]|uniref:MMS19 nucleotide excision repair protein n=1 Tax=Pichia membranifaciens NRRL Y-2026 TaxID=763406 RepID=A0A1E3NR14_9ASCO|nr:hypothetical protein PICMEDRAFT_70154 [Pichia membranifaciens NRRL Y-2026]ODQ48526.1 hypothetical protein PICMEDRAFT_70154 [Pichia membranifaciens NRRL Y-2026]